MQPWVCGSCFGFSDNAKNAIVVVDTGMMAGFSLMKWIKSRPIEWGEESFLGPHDIWGSHHRSKNIFAIVFDGKLIIWILGLRQLSVFVRWFFNKSDYLLKSAMHDATSRLQFPLLQLTEDVSVRMILCQGPREWFPGPRCGSQWASLQVPHLSITFISTTYIFVSNIIWHLIYTCIL